MYLAAFGQIAQFLKKKKKKEFSRQPKAFFFFFSFVVTVVLIWAIMKQNYIRNTPPLSPQERKHKHRFFFYVSKIRLYQNEGNKMVSLHIRKVPTTHGTAMKLIIKNTVRWNSSTWLRAVLAAEGEKRACSSVVLCQFLPSVKKIKDLRLTFDYLKIITQVLFHFNFWHLKYFKINKRKFQSENFFLIKEAKKWTKDGNTNYLT